MYETLAIKTGFLLAVKTKKTKSSAGTLITDVVAIVQGLFKLSTRTCKFYLQATWLQKSTHCK